MENEQVNLPYKRGGILRSKIAGQDKVGVQGCPLVEIIPVIVSYLKCVVILNNRLFVHSMQRTKIEQFMRSLRNAPPPTP